ncbi:AAA family ATPase [Streptomyces cavernae]|uniref:AAA family ATPase n=1 Tax=Streptomyces cavernae TaxID=2259034 RepID=UPI000FEBC1BD|nr:AAA family ATPase [Streptomyces cavernae]
MSDTFATYAESVGDERRRSFGSHLAHRRKRVFVGRQEELALFRAAIGDGGHAAVLYIHGPGGVGKSTLLRRLADEAVDRGRHVIEVDGRTTDPSPESFQAAVGTVPEGSVLLIDTFERCQGLEEGLRERFLPTLPHDTTVVVAGREAPSTDWYIDPAWDETLHVLPLGDLAHDDALALIRARGVPPGLYESVTSFAGRYPLALSLTAAVVSRRMSSSMDWTPTPNIVETLLRHLVGSTPSPLHRHALEVCAHAMTTTEDLLQSVFGDEHAGELFDWLRGLPFVESGPGGVFPHDVVREALDSDLRWRDFTGYQKMHRRVREYAIEQVRRASGPSVLMAARAANYLMHHGPFKMAYHSWRGNGEVYEAPYRPQDWSAVVEMVRVRPAFTHPATPADHRLRTEPPYETRTARIWQPMPGTARGPLPPRTGRLHPPARWSSG